MHRRTSGRGCRAPPRRDTELARPPTPSSTAWRSSGSGQFRVPSGMTTHSDRPSEVQSGDLPPVRRRRPRRGRGSDRAHQRRPSPFRLQEHRSLESQPPQRCCHLGDERGVGERSEREVAELLEVLAVGSGTERLRNGVLQLRQAHAAHRRRRRSPRSRWRPPRRTSWWGASVPGAPRRPEAGAGAVCSNRRPRPARTCGRGPGWRTGAGPRRRMRPLLAWQGTGPPRGSSSTRRRTNRRDRRVSHGVGDGVVAEQQPAVGRGRVRAVEEPELAPLEGGDVVDELGRRHRPGEPIRRQIRMIHERCRSVVTAARSIRPSRRRCPLGRARSARAPSGRRPSWGTEPRPRSTARGDGSMRSAISRTRVRRTLPLSRRLSSEAKTGGSNPSRRHWASASAMSPGVVDRASDGSRRLQGGRRSPSR